MRGGEGATGGDIALRGGFGSSGSGGAVDIRSGRTVRGEKGGEIHIATSLGAEGSGEVILTSGGTGEHSKYHKPRSGNGKTLYCMSSNAAAMPC